MRTSLGTIKRFRTLFQPSFLFCTVSQDPNPSQIPSTNKQALQQALQKTLPPSDDGLLRSLPIFQAGYGEDDWRKKRKKKHVYDERDLEMSGDEEAVNDDDADGEEVGVPTVILRKKKRNTGSAPKLFSHLYPQSDYVFLGELAVMRIIGYRSTA